MISDAVTLDQADEVFGRISRKRRFLEVGIAGDEILGSRMNVGEITSAAARDTDLPADTFVAFQNDYGPAALSRLDGAHEPGGARTDDDNVISHERIIYDDAGRVRLCRLCTKSITKFSE